MLDAFLGARENALRLSLMVVKGPSEIRNAGRVAGAFLTGLKMHGLVCGDQKPQKHHSRVSGLFAALSECSGRGRLGVDGAGVAFSEFWRPASSKSPLPHVSGLF